MNAAAATVVGDLLLVPAQSVKHLSAEGSSSGEESSDKEEDEDEEESDSSGKNAFLHYYKSESRRLMEVWGCGAAKTPVSRVQTAPNISFEAGSTKRLRPRFAICENCSEEYDVTCNLKGDCICHDGMYIQYASHYHWLPFFSKNATTTLWLTSDRLVCRRT